MLACSRFLDLIDSEEMGIPDHLRLSLNATLRIDTETDAVSAAGGFELGESEYIPIKAQKLARNRQILLLQVQSKHLRKLCSLS